MNARITRHLEPGTPEQAGFSADRIAMIDQRLQSWVAQGRTPAITAQARPQAYPDFSRHWLKTMNLPGLCQVDHLCRKVMPAPVVAAADPSNRGRISL